MKEQPKTDPKTSHKEEMQKSLEEAMRSITKAYGDGSIMRMNSTAVTPVAAVPTGAISMDLALGIGGLPRGRVVEIYGPEASGKTTLALQAITNVQKNGGICALIDAEHALDPKYAKALGVNLDDLLVSQPSCGEEALSICETLARSGAVDMIVIDSVAALVPKSELEGEMGMATMGMQARLMSQALRKLTSIVHKANTLCLFINQMREKVGMMFGNPETTPGGKALKFYASMRIDIRRKDIIKDSAGVAIGQHVKVKIVKNKLAPPFAEAEFDILYGKGIDTEADLLDTAVNAGIVEKKASWYSYAGNLLGQGKDAKRTLVDKPEIAKEIQEKLLAGKLKPIIMEEAEPPAMPEESEKK